MNPFSTSGCVWWICLLGMFPAVSSKAQNNYQPYVLGLRTAAMGGAATAAGIDSAMPWVNPAGLARTPADMIGITANAFVYQEILSYDYYSLNVRDALNLGIPTDNSRSTLDGSGSFILPTSLTYMLHLGSQGEHVLGLSYLKPFSSLYDKRINFDINLGAAGKVFSILSERSSMTQEVFGPSYAFRSGIFAIGASAFVQRFTVRRDSSMDTIAYSPSLQGVVFSPLVDSIQSNSYDLGFVLGCQVGPVAGGFFTGLSLHSPSLHLTGNLRKDAYWYSADTVNQEYFIQADVADGISFRVDQPFWLSVGLAYQREQAFALSLDAQLYLPVDYTNAEGNLRETVIKNTADPKNPGQFIVSSLIPVSAPIQKGLILNVGVGAEWFVSRRMVLRAGFFTDFSAFKPTALDKRTSSDVGNYSVNRYGATCGVAYTGQSTQFQMGFLFLGGLGDVVGQEWTVKGSSTTKAFPDRELALNTYMFIFSGEIDAGMLASSLKNAVVE